MYRDFGMTLAAKRKEKHLNQLQLADLLNKKGLEVKPGSISKWEKNVNSPNVIQFFALCEILGIDNINDTFGIAWDGMSLVDDVGGVGGFCEFLETINGDDPEEKKSYKTWARSLGWTGRMPKPENML